MISIKTILPKLLSIANKKLYTAIVTSNKDRLECERLTSFVKVKFMSSAINYFTTSLQLNKGYPNFCILKNNTKYLRQWHYTSTYCKPNLITLCFSLCAMRVWGVPSGARRLRLARGARLDAAAVCGNSTHATLPEGRQAARFTRVASRLQAKSPHATRRSR